jgi:RNA polymerase sigma-70 factor (ECF subfamily)
MLQSLSPAEVYTKALAELYSVLDMPEAQPAIRVAPDLERAVAQAVAAHPALPADDEAKSWIRARLEAVEGLPSSEVHVADLWLVHWALRRAGYAERCIEAHLRELPPMLARFRLSASALAETLQDLRHRLMVGVGAQPPRLGEYQGKGPLGAWLRTVAVRQVLTSVRTEGRRRESPIEDLAASALDDDPELRTAKQLYREPLSRAFENALRALSSKDRTLLRMYLLDGRNIDEIGKVFGVHRATVARWIADIRGGLAKATREELTHELSTTSAEFRSITRLCYSQLDVSIHRLLASQAVVPSSR